MHPCCSHMSDKRPRACEHLPALSLRGSDSKQVAEQQDFWHVPRHDLIHQDIFRRWTSGGQISPDPRWYDSTGVIIRPKARSKASVDAASPVPSVSINTWRRSVRNSDHYWWLNSEGFKVQRVAQCQVESWHQWHYAENEAGPRPGEACVGTGNVLTPGVAVRCSQQARDFPQNAPDQRAASFSRAERFNARHEVDRSPFAHDMTAPVTKLRQGRKPSSACLLGDCRSRDSIT